MSEFEAMVERACVQLHGRNWPAMGDALQAQLREEMRPVLTAAGVPELLAEVERLKADAARLDYIERTFSGMTNRERYLPVQMVWGKGCNGRSLREACDKYMQRVRLLTDTKEDGE